MPRLQWLCVFAWGRGRECLYSWFLTSAWRVPPSPLPQGVITAPVQVSSAASPVRGRHLSLGNGVLHLSFLIPLFLLGGSLTGLGLWFLGLSWVNHLRPGLHCFLSSLFSFFLFFFFFGFFETGFLCVALAVLELFVDQAGLELRNLPASACPVLGLKACASLFFLAGC